jgi:hypothetical protein
MWISRKSGTSWTMKWRSAAAIAMDKPLLAQFLEANGTPYTSPAVIFSSPGAAPTSSGTDTFQLQFQAENHTSQSPDITSKDIENQREKP